MKTLVATLAILLSAHAASAAENCLDKSVVCAQDKTVYESLNRFDLKIARQILDKDISKGKSSFLSPVSIHSAMALIANGAGGTTGAQILTTLGLPADRLEALNQANHNQMTVLGQLKDDYNQVKKDHNYITGDAFDAILANSVWYRGNIVPEAPFVSVLKSNYDAKFSELSTKDAGAKRWYTIATADINAWAAEVTKGLVPHIINEDVIADPDFAMLLANAIYVKGSWTASFKVQDGTQPFHGLTGDSTFTAMHRANSDMIYEDDRFVAVNLDTAGHMATMTVVLPKTAKDAASFASATDEVLTADFWKNVDTNSKKKKVDLTMPKFSLDFSAELNDDLKALGILDAFDKGKADFRGITHSQSLYVSKVKHDSALKVNENGFEAAAVTTVIMSARSAVIQEEVATVRLDRPFLYVIRDTRTHAVLFVGSMLKP